MKPNYEQILITLSVALGLSFIIERILQFLKTLFDRFLFAGDMLSSAESPSAKEAIDKLERRHQQDDQDTQAEYLEESKAKLKYHKEELSKDESLKLEQEIKGLERSVVDTSKAEQNKRFTEATVFLA